MDFLKPLPQRTRKRRHRDSSALEASAGSGAGARAGAAAGAGAGAGAAAGAGSAAADGGDVRGVGNGSSGGMKRVHGGKDGAAGSDKGVHSDRPDAEDDDDDALAHEKVTFGTNITAIQYEYLDHTADIQLHSWGATLAECLEQLSVCMFGYMTELETVTIDEAHSRAVQASGHDIVSLVFNFLDELLYRFHSEGLVVTDIKVVQLDTSGDKFYIKAHCKGDLFDLKKHPQGTEIKAITYSNMQIVGWDTPTADKVEAFVIVDI